MNHHSSAVVSTSLGCVMLRIKLVGSDSPATALQGGFVGDSLARWRGVACAAEVERASVCGVLDAPCGDKCCEDRIYCGCGELVVVCPKIAECRGYRAASKACEFGCSSLTICAKYPERGVRRKIRNVSSVKTPAAPEIRQRRAHT